MSWPWSRSESSSRPPPGFFVLPRASARKIDKSIAVLPFENFSDDKDNAFFADGIQDDILTNLAKIGDLKVISRTSVMPYRGKEKNVREIGQALGVSTILEGSVRKAGNRVRVNVQLINAVNDEHIWAEDYDRDLTDVFAIQTDLAQKIAHELQAKLSPTEKAQMTRKPTENGEAYLAFVQAHNLHTQMEEFDKLKQAEQLYERALQLDPNFSLAAADFSRLESWIYHTYDPTPARREKARALAERSLETPTGLPGMPSRPGLFILLWGPRLRECPEGIRDRRKGTAERSGGFSRDRRDPAAPGKMEGIEREPGESGQPEPERYLAPAKSRAQLSDAARFRRREQDHRSRAETEGFLRPLVRQGTSQKFRKKERSRSRSEASK